MDTRGRLKLIARCLRHPQQPSPPRGRLATITITTHTREETLGVDRGHAPQIARLLAAAPGVTRVKLRIGATVTRLVGREAPVEAHEAAAALARLRFENTAGQARLMLSHGHGEAARKLVARLPELREDYAGCVLALRAVLGGMDREMSRLRRLLP